MSKILTLCYQLMQFSHLYPLYKCLEVSIKCKEYNFISVLDINFLCNIFETIISRGYRGFPYLPVHFKSLIPMILRFNYTVRPSLCHWTAQKYGVIEHLQFKYLM